ncbi:DUF3667 domain-containing protein [Pelomonas sp. SE-A7]|uniref:DUF3667 domain-containing protein n=1 Tax=Pelomonas sp. SE-A7 TaxID=3054953 RepID=UPI00259CA62B|nr:DUF3667 domain-containing protein [Pelomonas sp. SE-A7]MDM4766101.1 DUF3667 domain-containing protein [Pelomonas sp. SE-A7]
MTGNIELATEALAQAVVADEMGRGEPGQGAAGHSAQACANCGATLTGRFCQHCGQAAHVHRSLLHMFEELLHGILHFDTKAWRTLPALVLRPGRLTRGYIDGQRASHVSPLALYLFMIFVMFMTFSLTSSEDSVKLGDGTVVTSSEVGLQRIDEKLASSRERLQRLEAQAVERGASANGAERLDGEIKREKERIDGLERTRLALELGAKPKLTGEDGKAATQAPQSREADVKRNLEKNLPFLATPTLIKKLAHAMDNQELALYKIKSASSKFAILLMPISLPFVWLLFLFRRQFTMFDHAVFLLYSLSFMCLLLSGIAVAGALGLPAVAALLVIFAPPVHMYAQLKGTYRLGWLAATWRTVALLFVALLCSLLYILLVMFISM